MTDDRRAASPGPILLDLDAPQSFPSAPPSAASPPPSAVSPPPLVAEVNETAVVIEAPPQSPASDEPLNGGVPTLPIPRIGGPKWPMRLFVGGTVAAVLTGVGFDAADLLGRAFAVSQGLGWGVAAALGGAGLGLVSILWREWRGLARLRRFEDLRRRTAVAEAGDGGGAQAAGAVAALYAGRRELADGLERLRLHLPDAHDDHQALELVEREVLAPLDAAAYRLTATAARDTALSTALVPVALLDMLIVLWRNLKLVRGVAALYGVRPGYWASLRLMRKLLGNLAVAGVGESVATAAADALGGTLAAAVSANLGKGVVNGLLTARIGLAAMHFCRPVAFSPKRRPSLSGIRAALLGLPKTVL